MNDIVCGWYGDEGDDAHEFTRISSIVKLFEAGIRAGPGGWLEGGEGRKERKSGRKPEARLYGTAQDGGRPCPSMQAGIFFKGEKQREEKGVGIKRGEGIWDGEGIWEEKRKEKRKEREHGMDPAPGSNASRPLALRVDVASS